MKGVKGNIDLSYTSFNYCALLLKEPCVIEFQFHSCGILGISIEILILNENLFFLKHVEWSLFLQFLNNNFKSLYGDIFLFVLL